MPNVKEKQRHVNDDRPGRCRGSIKTDSGSFTYFPPPVRAVSIPKKSGGQRVLGVPTVADRVAQMVVKQVIERF